MYTRLSLSLYIYIYICTLTYIYAYVLIDYMSLWFCCFYILCDGWQEVGSA